MNTRHRLAVALLPLIAAGCASLAAPNVRTEPEALRAGAYALDQKHAALLFKADHLGFSKFVGRFESFDASLDFEAANPEAARIDAVIDIASLDIANDAFARTLTGPDWFDSGQFPQARFRSTAVTRTGETSGRMTGDLTLHGVTLPVTLEIAFNGGAQDLIRGDYVVGFSARGVFNRGDFGVDKYDGIVGDEIEIEIEAEFERKRRG